MSIDALYETAAYEVLDQQAHHYSSTTVSGGGGYVHNSGGYINPIRTHVEHHVEQELWCRNLDTGLEEKLEFRGFKADVRPGHRIVVARHRNSGLIERIYNFDTDVTQAGAGSFPFGDLSPPKRFVYWVAGALMMFVQFSIPITLAMAFFIWKKGYRRNRLRIVPELHAVYGGAWTRLAVLFAVYGLGVLVIGGALSLIKPIIGETGVLLGLVPAGLYMMKLFRDYFVKWDTESAKAVMAHRDKLDNLFNRHVDAWHQQLAQA